MNRMTPTPANAPTPITVSASLSYANTPIQNQALVVAQRRAAITGKHFSAATMSVPTTPGGTLIPLGNLSSLGVAMFVNNDATNFVDVLTGVGGLDFARMMPGEPLLIRFGQGVTAPALLANTAPVDVEYLILEA